MQGAAYRLGAARRQVQDDLVRGQSLPFEHILPSEHVERVIKRHVQESKKRLWPVVTTLWSFVRQALEQDGSCSAALEHRRPLLARRGKKCSTSTSGYCQARQRLPQAVPEQLCTELGAKLHEQVPKERLWCGRKVVVADGSGASMLDTPSNQAAYPQPSTQKKGCGFPVLRFVVLLCLMSGAALAVSLGPLSVSENALFHQLWHVLHSGSVLLGDRLYSSYCDLALLRSRGVDVVARLNTARKLEGKNPSKRLGRNDALYEWNKDRRPQWLEAKEFRAVPKTMLVRIVLIDVTVPGFRSEHIVLCTTLLDATLYPAHKLAELYRLRWHAELDLRHIKTSMGMDVLSCRSPEMVRKDFWVHFLAYNLLRSLMSYSAALSKQDPLRLSVKSAMQMYLSFSTLLSVLSPSACPLLLAELREALGSSIVPSRPDRVEPRCIKRRARDYPRLGGPRHRNPKAVKA